ncbi:MAG: fibronectin type III domain-containing protein [Prevotellaceae bacterium]|jgi:cellulose 1,4-beta-cellobiosidase|nr:fibronectin type III domain-containing protein [Prevotellaceae bacterium]
MNLYKSFIFAMWVLSALAFSSCKEEEKGQQEILEVSPTQLSFGSEGGAQTIDVVSSGYWSLYSNGSWCSARPSSGSGNASITVTASNNTSTSQRNASIGLSSSSKSATVNVTQAGSTSNNGGGNDGTLSAPTGVTTTKEGSSIRIAWSSVSSATSYKVYYSSSANGTYSSLGSATTQTYAYDNNPNSTDNYYKVKAVSGTTESEYSSSAYCNFSAGGGGATIPSAPTGVSATAQSSSSISVSWNAVSGATYYEVYYEIGTSSTKNLATTTYSTSYTHTELQAGTTYYYYIKAKNGAGASDYSSNANATTSSGVAAPSAPTGVTASRSPRSSEYVTVSWNAVNGATSYKVYYSMSASGSYSLLGTVTGTSSERYFYNDQTSYWKVAAVNSAGESAMSSTYGTALGWQSSSGGGGGSGTTKLATPTNVKINASDTYYVQISFTPVTMAYTYELYRATSATGTYSKITSSGGSSGSVYILTDSNPRTGTSFYKVKAIALSSSGYTDSNLSDYASVTR